MYQFNHLTFSNPNVPGTLQGPSPQWQFALLSVVYGKRLHLHFKGQGRGAPGGSLWGNLLGVLSSGLVLGKHMNGERYDLDFNIRTLHMWLWSSHLPSGNPFPYLYNADDISFFHLTALKKKISERMKTKGFVNTTYPHGCEDCQLWK